MTHFKCPYCTLTSHSDDVTCRRCEGSLRNVSPLERLLYRIHLLRRLIRYREWESTSGGSLIVRQVQLVLTLTADWRGPLPLRELSLLPLRNELTWMLYSQISSWSQFLSIGRACVELLPADGQPPLLQHIERIEALVSALNDTEKKLAGGLVVDQDKLHKWFSQQAKNAGLTIEVAIRHAFATVERWPHLLHQLQPAEYKSRRTELLIFNARVAIKQKDYELARKRYQEILQAAPNCISALEGLGKISARLGEIEAAVAAFGRAIELGTIHTDTYNDFAWFVASSDIYDQSRLQHALLAARRAVEEMPVGSYFDTLSEVLFALGYLDDAIAAARQGIDEDPEKAILRERLLNLCMARDRGRSASKAARDEVSVDVLGDDDDEAGKSEGDESYDSASSSVFDSDDTNFCLPSGVSGVASTEDSNCSMAPVGPVDEDDAFELTDDAAMGDVVSDVEEFDEAVLTLDDSSDEESLYVPAGKVHTSGEKNRPFAKEDVVSFSVTSPASMVHGECYVVEVWAHLPREKDEVLSAAREMLGGQSVDHKTKAGIRVEQGTVLSVQISIPKLVVEDPCDQIVWTGNMANATFPVFVPEDVKPGTYAGTAVIHSASIALAKLHFVIKVGQKESKLPVQSTPCRSFRTAFASYASKDRDAVLGRIQGIQKALPELDVFVDVAKLRSGSAWSDQLSSEIAQRDVFYLFWSKAASESEWVDREWRLALAQKGIDRIDPVPLVSPEKVPPPQELASVLHFNDWMLAFMRES